MPGKEYQMAFSIGAKLQSQYGAAFKNAQASVVSLQGKVEALNKARGNIQAYQKEQEAMERTREKLELHSKEYEVLRSKMEQAGDASEELQTKMLRKQLQIENDNKALEAQKNKLGQLGSALQEAGVDTGNLTAEQTRLAAELEGAKTQQEALAASAQGMSTSLGNAANTMSTALVSAGVVAALTATASYLHSCAEAAMEFETGMAGVQRTVGGSDSFIAKMGDDFKNMSVSIPITTTELASIATTAGQLGVAQEDVQSFTSVMAQLSTTTDLTAENAATMLAQFSNITGADDYERLGSTVASLGDATATTATNVVEMSQGMAAAATQAGMSATDILGISAAVSSLGIEAQAGSTSMSTLISQINAAVETGDGLEDFASVANMTAGEFQTAWGQNAAGALNAFIQGLNDTERNGESAIVTLNRMGITNVRQTKAILGLASAGSLLSDTIAQANTAWAENTALAQKAGIMYATTQSKLIMAQNAVNNLHIAIGSALTPAIGALAEGATPIIQSVAEYLDKHPALVQAVTTAGLIFGGVTVAITAYAVAAKAAAAVSAMLATAFGGISLGTIFGITAAVAALAAGIVLLTSAMNGDKKSMEDLDAEYDALMSSFNDTNNIIALCEEYRKLKGELQETFVEAQKLDGTTVTSITLRAILTKEGFTNEDDLAIVETFSQDIQTKAGVMMQILTLNGAKNITEEDLETITSLGSKIQTDSGELKQFLTLKGAEEITPASLQSITDLGAAVKDGTYQLLQTLGFSNPNSVDADDVALIVSMAAAIANDEGNLSQLLSLTGAESITPEAVGRIQTLSQNIYTDSGILSQTLGFTDEDHVTLADILRISAMAAVIADDEGALRQSLSLIGAENVSDESIGKITSLAGVISSGYGMIWQTLSITGADSVSDADIAKINSLHNSIAEAEGELKQALSVTGAENVTDDTINDIVRLKENIGTGYGSLRQALAITLGVDVTEDNVALIDDLANSIATKKGELAETLKLTGFDSYEDLQKACALSDAVKAANYTSALNLHLTATGDDADTLMEALKKDTVSLQITAGLAEGFTMLTADDFVSNKTVTLTGREDAEHLLEATKLLKDGSAWISLDAQKGETLLSALDLLKDDPIIQLTGSASEKIASTDFFTGAEDGSVTVMLTPEVAETLNRYNLLDGSTVTLTPDAQKTLAADAFMLGQTVDLTGDAVGKLYASAFLNGDEYVTIKGKADPGTKITAADYITETERQIALTASVTNMESVKSTLASLQTEADSLNAKAASAKTELTTAQTQLIAMETRRDQLAERLKHAGDTRTKNELQEAIEAQNTAIGNQEEKVAALETAYSSATTQYNLSQAAVEALSAKQQRLMEIETQLSGYVQDSQYSLAAKNKTIEEQIDLAQKLAEAEQAQLKAQIYNNAVQQSRAYADALKEETRLREEAGDALNQWEGSLKYAGWSSAALEDKLYELLEAYGELTSFSDDWWGKTADFTYDESAFKAYEDEIRLITRMLGQETDLGQYSRNGMDWRDYASDLYSLSAANSEVTANVAEMGQAIGEYDAALKAVSDTQTIFVQNLVDGVANGAITTKEAWRLMNNALEDSKATQEEVEKATMALTEALAANAEEAQEASSGMGKMFNSAAEVEAALRPVMDAMQQLSESYQEAYDEAYKSIDGQLKLFEAAPEKTEESVNDMIAALNSQAEYMREYAMNLQAVKRMGLANGLVEQLSDGSKESAAYLAAIVKDGAGKIDELNTAFAGVESGKETFAKTVAEMQTNFSKEMDALTKGMASAVEGMTLTQEAADAGAATVQAYADAAKDKASAVQSAFDAVANAARNALNLKVSTEEYAAGTQSAARGFALVGENGPELVWMNGGEQVMNASDTGAFMRDHALEAAGMSAGGSVHIEVKPIYNLSGAMDNDSVRGILDEQTRSIRDMVEDALSEIEADRGRTVYSP